MHNLFLFFFLSFSSFIFGDVYQVKDGTCEFLVTGKPGFIKINGTGGKVSGQFTIENNSVLKIAEIKVSMKDFQTGIDTRDSHMKEKYLEVEKFPEAIFSTSEVKFEKNKIPEIINLKGSLKLHGISHPVEAELKVVNKDKSIEIDGSFNILIDDYQIVIPSFMGITVAKEVDVKVHFVGSSL